MSIDGDSPSSSATCVPPDTAGLYELIVQKAQTRATFVEWADGALRYDALLGDVWRFCGLFDQHELEPSTHVLIVTGNERHAIGAFIAALLDGLVPVMLAPETPAPRAEAIAKLLSPGLVFVDVERLDIEPWARAHPVLAVPAAPQKKTLLQWFSPGRNPRRNKDAQGATAARAPRCAAGTDDLAYILFTSGTTSVPKGVMITHGNLFAHLETLARTFCYTPDSGLFNGMVLAHADGFVQGPLLALACGCRLIRPPAFTAQTLESWLNMVHARRATHLLTVPSVYAFIDRYAAHDDYFAAQEFEAFISVAAKLEAPLWQRLETRFARPVYNMYGLTETVASALYAGPAPDMGPIGTIGRPIDVAVRIARPDGTEAAPGEAGEIWLNGENVSPGYFRAPAATAERFADGWLKTGDLGMKRPDGAFEITGRLKTAIMCGGFLIQPEEIDEALLRHPAVAEAVTIGTPDDHFGEAPLSAVVLDGVTDEADLTAHCARNLEPRKVPKRIIPVKTIPRGDAGKPQIAAVRAMLEQVAGATPRGTTGNNTETAVLEAAARTFRMPVEALSSETTPETVDRWDSFAHVSLIAAVEASLGIRLPTREVIAVNSLGALTMAAARQMERD